MQYNKTKRQTWMKYKHGCLFVVRVVYCQMEVSATGRSLVQRNPSDCDVHETTLAHIGLLRQKQANVYK
jgi:hypothetical protein